MQRRSFLRLSSLLPFGLFASRYLKAAAPGKWRRIDYQAKDYKATALRLNELAGNIHSAQDAHVYVDFVASIFSDDMPRAWGGRRMRDTVADAEFAAVSRPPKLIPEERVAEAWNRYAQTIQAPQERPVTGAEIHNLRDAFFATAALSWARGARTIWTVPAIYATKDDGTMAEGCRAIESLRILWDLANMPRNLAGARARVSQGVLVSEQLREAQKHVTTTKTRAYLTAGPGTPNLVAIAAREYVARKGARAFGKVVTSMVEQVLV
ncbi:MAG: hypothetical protein WBY53_07340 [Acidobacteriaceae bacterium]